MGRRRMSISRIENRTTRQVTFAKRRVGLFKKTHELSVLCDAQIGLIVFSSTGKLFEYCSTEGSSMEDMIRRYRMAKGIQNPDNNDQLEKMHGELTRMQKETLNLQLSLQRYIGEDLSSIQFGDLHELEKQLEYSVNKVRARKFELLEQQMDNLRRKIKENQAALEHHEQVATLPKTEEHRHALEQFPFSGEEQPSSVLQLATLPSIFNPYRLQPAQPNLQDFFLQPPNYGTSI
uniref:MADS-box protein FBP24 n=1 Tax=Fagus sylvatica TaxID=28930 RepID=A0A2N9EQ81_FAGSY